jgi:tetratricopeptide (TPR) repeat protein
MTNELTDNLFSLIKSLSPSEKRQFTLYVGRIGVNSDSKFLNLFKVMSRQKKYDEEYILKNTAISKQQLSNIKAHLYKQLLISLKLNPVHQSVPINIREQMDFAYILYRKGLYKQSLKILEKVKATALHYEEKVLAYDILEWEKIIESQYITRSTHNRAETLVQETKDLTELNLISGKLSNLSLQLYNIFLKMGHARTQEESDTIRGYFKQNLPEFDIAKLGFREKLWLYKAHLWYSFISQNFISCYRYSSKWIDLFKEYPHLISVHPVSYLKGNHYLLESLFYLNHTALFEKTLKHLEETLKDPKIPDDDNIATLSFLYVYSNKLNLRFMKGDFDNGDTLVEKIEKKIKKYGSRIDGHHIMIFYYKIASLYFGNGNYTKCIDFLKRIIDNKSLEVREDLMCFSRILNLVAHYEAGKDYHLESLVKSTYKFLIKMNDMHKVQKEMIRFLRNLPEVSPLYIKDEFRKLHSTLKVYEDHPYERRAFLYLDILSWLESRIEDRPVAEIIAEKVKLVSR